MNRKRLYTVLAIVILAGAMLYHALSTPGIADLQGDFEERAFARNEQNSGPVIRVYAVSVDSVRWEEMKQYGHYMPHTKYGTTKVYFFLQGKPAPGRFSEGLQLDPAFEEYCVAVYEKDGMGNYSISPYNSSEPAKPY